jgi:hypothetical protein
LYLWLYLNMNLTENRQFAAGRLFFVPVFPPQFRFPAEFDTGAARPHNGFQPGQEPLARLNQECLL